MEAKAGSQKSPARIPSGDCETIREQDVLSRSSSIAIEGWREGGREEYRESGVDEGVGDVLTVVDPSNDVEVRSLVSASSSNVASSLNRGGNLLRAILRRASRISIL